LAVKLPIARSFVVGTAARVEAAVGPTGAAAWANEAVALIATRAATTAPTHHVAHINAPFAAATLG
jgi:hypothetical protein